MGEKLSYVTRNLNFHPLEVVDRVSETHLQVGENSDSGLHKLFRFDNMEVNCFQILLIGVTFYL